MRPTVLTLHVNIALRGRPFHLLLILQVFQELRLRAPDLLPLRMLDFGAGPGTATWAAAEVRRATASRAILGISGTRRYGRLLLANACARRPHSRRNSAAKCSAHGLL